MLEEIHNLSKENEELRLKINSYEKDKFSIPEIEDIAKMNEPITIHGIYTVSYGHRPQNWKYVVTWDYIFNLIAPILLEHPNDALVLEKFKNAVLVQHGINHYDSYLDEQVFQTIKVQLMAYGLVNIEYLQTVGGTMALFWNLTEKGKIMMMQLRVIRSTPKSELKEVL